MYSTTKYARYVAKETRKRIKDLQRARQDWIRASPNELHFDYCLRCTTHRTPDPYCEGCCTTLFRADRIAEIEAQIRNLTSEPDMYKPKRRAPKQQPVQPALF